LFLQLNNPPSALNQVNYKNGESYEQKDVDESPERVGRHHTQEPKDTQHNENCPKHCVPISQDPTFTALVAQLEIILIF
jgi:hypothetical protein